MRIIVDAFGGDNAPLEIVKGAAQAVCEYGVDITLTGKEETIRRVAAENGVSLDGMDILDCDDVITMEDHPGSILKEHKNSSMAVGLRALAQGEGDAFVSAGSTGALVMGGTFLVKRIKGVSRAALAALLPSDKGPVMLIDSGANVECRPEMLLRFGQMGSLYMSEVMGGGRQVSVGLLNVGTEETKGGELQQQAYALLKNSGLHFIGNIEARQVPFGEADVVVADGLSGNVLLKTMEGTADLILQNVKDIFYANLKTKLAGALVKSRINGFKKKMSTSEYGGAPLLGVTKPVIKTHGNAKASGVKNAIRVAADFARAQVIEKISDAVKEGAAVTPDE
ncbi:MAG: phosphate acyltransferase PlsX [Acutalibacteraceae bacterium]